MRRENIGVGDAMLRKNLDTTDELGVIDPVALWKDSVEECWAETKHVELKFTGLVARVDFFSNVAGFAVKGARWRWWRR